MKLLKEKHEEAMRLAEQAIMARGNGDNASSVEFFFQAFKLERDVAEAVDAENAKEPTRSILLNSAANLALNCGRFREAEKLISRGLAGNPPEEIAEEMRDLLERVYFGRHLELKGTVLDPRELQFAMSGGEVGFGIVRSDEFLTRVDTIKKLAYRTAQRIEKKPFQDRGKPPKELADAFEPFISVPRAASFAVTIRFGASVSQQSLFVEQPGRHEIVIDEMLTCLEFINTSNRKKLQELIPDDSYRRNFIALAKKLAPDGRRVKMIGFTVLRGGEPRKVPIDITRKKIEAFKSSVNSASDREEAIELIGQLSFADADKGNIKLTDKNGKKHLVAVPKGLLSDVVKPHWEDTVTIRAKRKGAEITLEEIEKAE